MASHENADQPLSVTAALTSFGVRGTSLGSCEPEIAPCAMASKAVHPGAASTPRQLLPGCSTGGVPPVPVASGVLRRAPARSGGKNKGMRSAASTVGSQTTATVGLQHRQYSAYAVALARVGGKNEGMRSATSTVASQTTDSGLARLAETPPPNPSLELTSYGRRRLAAPGHGGNCPSAAKRHLPPRAAQLQR